MSIFYDFLPVLLFFIAFKWYGIYTATVVGIIATGLQVLITRTIKNKFDKQQLITFFVFVIFGSMTLYFHNPIFIKWKPTIIFWIFGLVLIISQLIGSKPLMQRMLEKMMEEKANLPTIAWKKINLAWSLFFITMGAINIFVAYTLSTDAWVNFKFYGILGAMLGFSFLQAIYLSRYAKE
jgi:intracellular septation protein